MIPRSSSTPTTPSRFGRRVSILLLAVILTCGAVLRTAQADPAYDRCIKQSDGTNQAWAACGGELIGREDSRLNATWKKVHSLLEPDAARALLAEQRAWIAYRDASCTFYATGDYGREGQVLNYPTCRAAVIASRVADIARIGAFVSTGR